MFSFLSENLLSDSIKKLLMTEPTLRIATAFIGTGASQLIGHKSTDVKIVCNLTMGGTNPHEVATLIQRFGKNNIRQINNLHAKLYIGSEYAIVGSANLSNNGLGFQPTALREAGYMFPLDLSSQHDSLDWFDQLWGEAREITSKDLKDAEEKWKRRDKNRDGDWNFNSRDICHYDFDRDDFPLLDWFGNTTWEVVDNAAVNPTLLSGWSSLEDAVSDSVDITCEHDMEHLQKDRWVLRYYVRTNAKLQWSQLSGIVLPNIYQYEGETETMSVALIRPETHTGPFDMNKATEAALRGLLFSDKYAELRTDDFEGCWFEPRVELMRQFWKELQIIACRFSRFAVKD